MIKANPGHRVRVEREGARPFWREVEAWADDGHPMVVGSAGLVRAETFPGYAGIETLPNPDPTPFAFLPGGGWTVERAGGTREPVVGWAVSTYGGGQATHAVPLVMQYEESSPSGHIPLAGMVDPEDRVRVHPPKTFAPAAVQDNR